MTYEEIKAEMQKLETAMMERDMTFSSAQVTVNTAQAAFFLSWAENINGATYKTISGEDYAEVLAKAWEFVASIPTGQERARANARAATAEALELCRAADIEGEVLAQMEACMKALSENVLTKQEL